MSRETGARTVVWETRMGRETGVGTMDEWRRACEVAEFELASFDRREAGSFLQTTAPAIWAASPRRRRLVAALEDAQVGLVRATEAAEAETPHEPTSDLGRAAFVSTDERATSAQRRRARSVSDVPGAYDDAIRAIERTHGKLTWLAVAMAIAGAHDITVSESTLRRWCKEEGLPLPAERGRLLRA
jgi:hypothetical protein